MRQTGSGWAGAASGGAAGGWRVGLIPRDGFTPLGVRQRRTFSIFDRLGGRNDWKGVVWRRVCVGWGVFFIIGVFVVGVGRKGVGVIEAIGEDVRVVGRVFVEGVFEVVRLGFFTGIEVGEVFGVSGWPGILGADEAETLAMPEWDEVPPGPPFVAGLGHADREKVEESHPTLVDGLVEDLLDEGVDLLLVGELTGHSGAGGEGPGEDAEVAGDLDVVDGALAQEAVGQGAEEGDFAFHAGAVGRQAGQGRADSGEGATAMGPSASDVSTAPDGAGILPRRIAAGIRFCAKGGSAGFLPRRIAAGIRFYAEGGSAGFLPRRIAAGIRFCAKGGSAGFLPRRIAAGIRFCAGHGGAGILPRWIAAGIRERVGLGVQTNRLLSRRPDGESGGGV